MGTKRRLLPYSILSPALVLLVWEMNSTTFLEWTAVRNFPHLPRVVLSAAVEAAVLSRKLLHQPDFAMEKKSPPKSESLLLTMKIGFAFSFITYSGIFRLFYPLFVQFSYSSFSELLKETKRLFWNTRTTF